jgi:uncharacterized BrkB/YihY/UPF0761 family membrane protein
VANKLQKTLQGSRKSWLLLIQATAWIGAVIASFVLPPPVGTADETKVWVRFAQFIITIFIGLLVLLTLRWTKKKHILSWAAVSASFLMLGTICFFIYQILATRWTTSYDKDHVLIGDTLTKQAAEYLRENPTLTRSDLVMHYGGSVDKIWTIESINQRRFILAGVYVLTMPIFTICIIALLQAIQCATAERETRRRRTQPVQATSERT